MLERCPLCRARLQGLSTCQRCGADLMIPIRIEGEAHGRYLHCVALAMEGDIEAARLAADQAMHLKAQPLFGFWCAFLDSTVARPVLLAYFTPHAPSWQ